MRTILTFAALAFAAAVPSTAHAVTIVRDGDAYVVRAAPGEQNVLGMRVDSFDTTKISFSDRTSNPMSADPALGCEITRNGFGGFASCPVLGTGITTARLEAGDGDDELDINPFNLPFSAPVTMDGGPGNDDVEGPTTDLPVIVRGGDGNDRVLGGQGADIADGGAGNDTVDGGDGDDVVTGGAGDDVISGGRTFSTDVMDGGPGNDRVANDWTDGDSIRVTLDGVADDGRPGENDNVLSVEAIETRRIAFLVAGADPVDFSVTNTPAGNSTLIGSPGSDKLRSGAYDDRIEGRGGADVIAAGGGNDSIVGGPGPDTILADGGVICDFISCSENQQGNDSIDARDGEKDVIDCGPGTDAVLADAIDVTAGCEMVNGAPPVTEPPPAGTPSGGSPPSTAGCTVPKIRRGTTLTRARRTLARAGCKLKVRRVRSKLRAGRVVGLVRRSGHRLRPLPAGTRIAGTTKVVVKVSRGRR
jgi:Ca2+-binding RTX toxin-like protein